MLAFLYYTDLKDKVKDALTTQEISFNLKEIINVSIKINNRQY